MTDGIPTIENAPAIPTPKPTIESRPQIKIGSPELPKPPKQIEPEAQWAIGRINIEDGDPRVAMQDIAENNQQPFPEVPSIENSVDTETGENNPFNRYLDKRFENNEIYNASNYARELPPERRQEYKEQIAKTAAEITQNLQIDQEVFEDPLHAEAFLAVCDSWIINEANPKSPGYQAEKTFLTQFSRILAGSKSGANQEAYKNNEPAAADYVDDQNSKENTAVFAVVQKYENKDKSQKLTDQLAEFSDDSILAKTRKYIGITSADQESPFRIIVVDASKDEHWNPDKGQRDPSQWQLMQQEMDIASGKEPYQREIAMFVLPNPPDGIPTMVLSTNDFDALQSTDKADDEAEWERKITGEYIAHEYGHTQKMIAFGAGKSLGMLAEERRVIMASGSGGHNDIVLLKWAGKSLEPDQETEFKDRFDNASHSQESAGQFYQSVADNFGLRSSLLILATKPASYSADYGIDAIPRIRMDSPDRMGDLLQIVIDERERITPGSSARFTKYFEDHTPEDAGHALYYSRPGIVRLPENIENTLKQKIADKNTSE